MKNLISLYFVFLMSLTVYSQERGFAFYGKKINTDNVIEFSEVKNLIKNQDNVKAKIEGTIISTCPKKGCWMQVQVENDTIQVTFKDYGFFIPKYGMENKKTVIEGFAKQDTVSIELLRHYAEDAGKQKNEIEKIIKPEFKTSFIANGVIIK